MVLEFLTRDAIGFLATFAFVFALVFALMVYAKIFEESRKAVAAIAIVIGLVTAVYEPAVIVLTSIIPIAALVLVFLFFIIFIKKLLFSEKKQGEKRDAWPAMVGMGVMLILLRVFWDQLAGYIGFATIPGDTVLWSVGILIVIIIFVLAYSVWGAAE